MKQECSVIVTDGVILFLLDFVINSFTRLSATENLMTDRIKN